MVKKVHMVGICGTGMGSLAGLFQAAGWEVRGSDSGVYPPMSTQLEALGISIATGFHPSHLGWKPDLVVVGNIARPDNPEALEAERQGLAVTSMAAAIAEHFLAGRRPVVVAGTHGKTTTAALLSWVLLAAGRDPGFLIGGVVSKLDTTFRLGGGPVFVIEGDEYENAFFDRTPKFLRYRPHTAILTSVELDHVEIFADLDAVQDAFRRFAALLPADGRLVAYADDPRVTQVTTASAAPVTGYGLDQGPGTRGRLLEADEDGMTFQITREGVSLGTFHNTLLGHQNLLNLTATVEVLVGLGLTPEEIAAGLTTFPGVRRRQELLGVVAGVTVIDDFAHHPTAVRETLRALRLRFPGRNLVAVFEPRTNTTRRALFQDSYVTALSQADRVLIAAVDQPQRAPEGDRFDPQRLAMDLTKEGTRADYVPDVSLIVTDLATCSRPGDIIAVMSNGSFDGLHDRLLEALQSGSLVSGASGEPSLPQA